MKVTILTPSYNQAGFLEDALLSVREQDYRFVEHLVIDGASCDRSQDLLSQYAGERMAWFSEPDEGQVDALLKGLHLTNGEVVAWLNTDDIYLHKGVISKVVELFQTNPQVDWITGTGWLLNERGEQIRETPYQPQRINFEVLRYRNFVLQPATFLRRKILDDLPLDKSLHYTFDWDLWIRAVRQFRVLTVADQWAGYRWWSGSKTASRAAARVREQAEVTRRYAGDNSWQYRTLRFYFHLFSWIEALPAASRQPLRSFLHRSSSALSRLVNYRIAVA
ncbi:MAG: glycosyltransferase family 2 protein [Anaerolineales bacterium]